MLIKVINSIYVLICPFHVTFERFVPLNSSRPNKVINDGQCGDLVYPLQMIELSTNQNKKQIDHRDQVTELECGAKCDFVTEGTRLY